MLNTPLERANAYKEASAVLLSAAIKFVTDSDLDMFAGELDDGMTFTGKGFGNKFHLVLFSDYTFLWGGEETDFQYVLEIQVNLLRQRINEAIRGADPINYWRGSSEIQPGKILFTYTRDIAYYG